MLQALIDGLLMGGVYALAALGLSLIFGVMKITNFAHGAMMTVGMYVVYMISTYAGISPYISLVFAAVFLFGIGYVTQKYLIHKISGAPTHNQLLLTLGVAYILENTLLAVFTPNYKTLTVGTFDKMLRIGSITINPAKLIAFIVVIAVTAAVYYILYRTRMGSAIGAMCTGIAGALLTPVLSIYPTIGETFQLKCFVIAILGGMGNLWGALISGLIVGVVEALTGYYAGGGWSEFMIYIIFVLILLVKPAGLFGKGNRRDY